jgi:hypothetical protein
MKLAGSRPPCRSGLAAFVRSCLLLARGLHLRLSSGRCPAYDGTVQVTGLAQSGPDPARWSTAVSAQLVPPPISFDGRAAFRPGLLSMRRTGLWQMELSRAAFIQGERGGGGRAWLEGLGELASGCGRMLKPHDWASTRPRVSRRVDHLSPETRRRLEAYSGWRETRSTTPTGALRPIGVCARGHHARAVDPHRQQRSA